MCQIAYKGGSKLNYLKNLVLIVFRRTFYILLFFLGEKIAILKCMLFGRLERVTVYSITNVTLFILDNANMYFGKL